MAGPCLEQEQLRPHSRPRAVALAGEGRADAHLHAVRQHRRADVRQLEVVISARSARQSLILCTPQDKLDWQQLLKVL